MTYLILLVLGLLIGAVFLAVLLIGDRKEARLEAQRKALQEQIASASQPVEGAWPPPPGTSALPDFVLPATPAKTTGTRASNRKMVRTFFQIRNAAIGTVVWRTSFIPAFHGSALAGFCAGRRSRLEWSGVGSCWRTKGGSDDAALLGAKPGRPQNHRPRVPPRR